MGAEYPRFKAAAVQAAPVFLNKEATIEKTCSLIKEAADNGADLIAFPETYIPTYPYWPKEVKGRAPGYRAFVELFKNSVEIPGPDTDILCEAARKASAYVVVGLNERDKALPGTLYNTNLFIDKTGRIMGKHRKLVPTYGERCVWGMGDGSDLNVFDTDLGKMGSLICGEHFMTLSRFAMFARGEQIHIATWPGRESIITTIDTMCKSYALEGQMFVVVSSGFITPDMIPDDFELKADTEWGSRGGSGIIDPRGLYLAGPLYDREGIVYADIDMEKIIWAKAMVDVVGHYARYDVANLNLNEAKHRPIASRVTGDGGAAVRGCAGVPAELERLAEQLDGADPGELKAAINDLARRIEEQESKQGFGG
jgi:aliphatic nitrilase